VAIAFNSFGVVRHGTPLTPTATIGATDIAVVLGSHITLMR